MLPYPLSHPSGPLDVLWSLADMHSRFNTDRLIAVAPGSSAIDHNGMQSYKADAPALGGQQ